MPAPTPSSKRKNKSIRLLRPQNAENVTIGTDKHEELLIVPQEFTHFAINIPNNNTLLAPARRVSTWLHADETDSQAFPGIHFQRCKSLCRVIVETQQRKTWS